MSQTFRKSHLERKKMLYAPLDFHKFTTDAPVDPEVLVNCLPERHRKLKTINAETKTEMDQLYFKLQSKNGRQKQKCQQKEPNYDLRMEIGHIKKLL